MKNSQENTSREASPVEGQRLDIFFIKFPFLKITLTVLLFFALGFLIYSNTFESPFIFDDKPRISENPDIRIKELTVKNILKAVSGKKSAKSRPVGNISFALNYYFHQYKLKGYHIANIIIHILSGYFLYLFLKLTLNLQPLRPQFEHGEWVALFTALLWLVNPIQTQSVTYIVQRLNSMAAMFYILSFLLYLKGRLTERKAKRWTCYIGAVFVWVLALGCKQNTAMLPFFIFLYEWYFFQDLSFDWLKRNLKYFLIIFVVFIIVSLIYLGSKPIDRLTSIADYANKEFTLSERMMTQFRVVIYYLSLIFYPNPSRLNLDYDFPLSHSLINPMTTLLSLGLIMALIFLAVYMARKERLISYSILWFFGNLVIESSIIPVAIIFEHRLYLPSMLVCLIPVILCHRYIKLGWLKVGLLCAVVIVFSVWTYQRNRMWESALTLWRDCVKKSASKARPQYNLGVHLQDEMMIDEAIEHYRKALQINPNYFRSHNNLGIALVDQGKTDEAIEHYRKALQINPKFAEPHNNWGIVLADQGKTDEAIEHYRKALQIDPKFVKAHNNWGIALVKQGKTDEAIEHYRKALQINPNYAEAHNTWGIALADQGKTDEAIEHYRKALQIDPNYAEAHNNYGTALVDQGKTDEAIEHYRKALQINPKFAEAHNTWGIALADQDKTDEAIEHYRKALQINPNYAEAQFNLGYALAKQGKPDQAIAHFHKALQINPDYAEAHNNLGGELLKQGKLDEATDHFNKALRLDPNLAETHNNMGIILIQKGKIEAAISHFREALRIKPDFVSADANLKRASDVLEAMEEEMAKVREALRNKPDDPVLHYEMGNLFFGRGQLRKAISQFEKALSIQPDFTPALNNLALAYAADNQHDKALKAFKRVAKLQPDNAKTYYNIACMYSRLNEINESTDWLKKALNKGYNNWDNIKTDGDLENIRSTSAYKALIKGH